MNFESLIDSDFSGVISIRQPSRVIFRRAFGYADLPNRIPNRTNTRFATASAGKGFVAAGILRLAEQGYLALDTPISKLLSFDLRAIDPMITVRQLLNHTSGIPDYFDETVMEDYEELWNELPCYKMRTNSDLIPLFITKSMMYPAGEKFQYNNTGYLVLALVLESVTGLPFDRYLEQEIFAPCGMTRTGYYELDRLPGGCANAYIYDEARGEYRTNIFCVEAKGTGAGGAFTTAEDMEAFWRCLTVGKLLSEPTVSEMLRPQVQEDRYGYGVWLRAQADGTFLPYLQGSDPGASFISSYDRKSGTSVTILSNFGCNV